MNNFPIDSFLSSLIADGIHLTIRDYKRISFALQTDGQWTITRLQDTLLALLTKDEYQQEIFLRRFKVFFQQQHKEKDKFKDVDVDLALTDLKQLAQLQHTPLKPKLTIRRKLKKYCSKKIKLPNGKFILKFALTIALLLSLPIILFSLWTIAQHFIPKLANSKTLMNNTKKYAGIILLFASLFYFLWIKRKGFKDKEAHWEKEGPRHFPLGLIGGKPAPCLDALTLDQLADHMGYFQSEQDSRKLNVPASIKTTLNKGGIPSLEFYKHKQIRSLLILEDAIAEPIVWCSIARELAEGMAQRGIRMLYGRFNGSPEKFMSDDGSVYRLEDWEDQRQGLLLLIFTDGKGLHQHESIFFLESLARWPMAAWMELREPCFWDECTALPARYGIPIYHATSSGLLKAIRRFLTEQGEEANISADAISCHYYLPSKSDTKIEAYVERLLGDALIWAQDCALLQPVSPGMADALRRKFHPHLPYERIERLYRLPGTTYNVAGLHFSIEVLRTLRVGFLVHRNECEQEEILRFLMDKIKEVEPKEKDSLSHLAWETVKERVRMELEKDYDLERLAQLAKTPLGDSISISLENFGFPGQVDKIPLRIKFRNKNALRRLVRIAKNFNMHLPIHSAVGFGLTWGWKIKKHFKKFFSTKSRVLMLAFIIDFFILLLVDVLLLKSGKLPLGIGNIKYGYLGIFFLITFIFISQIMLFINEFCELEKKHKKKLLLFKGLLSITIVSIICYLLFGKVLSYFSCFILSMVACVSILCWRSIFYWVIPKINLQHKLLFLGTDELTKRVVREILADDNRKYQVAGLIASDPDLVGKRVLGGKKFLDTTVLGLAKDIDSIIKKEKK